MLNALLRKNAYGGGLTIQERVQAERLILTPAPSNVHSNMSCWVCSDPSLEDTGLCAGHAFYALVTRK